MNILQNLVFPSLEMHSVSEELYVRVFEGAKVSRSDKQINFYRKGALCVFDTFFNSLTIQTWKNKTAVRQIKLKLFGEGMFVLKVKRHKLHTDIKHISEEQITLHPDGTVIDFSDLDNHSEGMLFFELMALTEENTYINKGYYFTELEPVNPVKLGVVITHFNRKNYVLPAINRVSNELLQNPYYKDKIQLIVVDNSQNIEADEANQAIVLPNKNLGGSGGFTRGLMYLEEQKDYTHCLFMDDDASCEIESICRAYALLQYATLEKFAVAGAQLRDAFPHHLYEKGARFDFHCHPLHYDRNMKDIHQLLLAEYDDTPPNYGGWWFFAFKIKDVVHYPFPFFVRGDDILFSLINKFNIVTLNGIGVWAEDFFIKEGVWTRYLMFRAEAVVNLLTNPNYDKKKLKKWFSRLYLDSLFSYNYSSAKSYKMAVEDLLFGTKSFTDDIDASRIRTKLAALPQFEKMLPINRQDYDLQYPRHVSHRKMRMRKYIRKLTLNYILLPKCLMKKDTVYIHQPKHFGAHLEHVYRYQNIYYEHEVSKTGYIAKFDKAELIQGYKDYYATLKLIDKCFDSAKAEYLNKIDELTSRAFWEKVYQKKDD